MSEHKDLWDYAEAANNRAALQDREDRERTRQATIKKLRASGHWLTLLREKVNAQDIKVPASPNGPG